MSAHHEFVRGDNKLMSILYIYIYTYKHGLYNGSMQHLIHKNMKNVLDQNQNLLHLD